jgi:hypothetical protein
MSRVSRKSWSLLVRATILVCLQGAVSFVSAQAHPSAKDLLRQMTLAEKIAQFSPALETCRTVKGRSVA